MADSVHAQMLPDVARGNIRVDLREVASGLHLAVSGTEQIAPTDLVPVPDGSGRMFVVTLGGVIRLIDSHGDLAPTPYLDMSGPDTSLGRSHGFTTMAFHPGFADRKSPGFGKFYTLETENAESATWRRSTASSNRYCNMAAKMV